MRPAALAFDTVAAAFDARYGDWASVSAQRRAVRNALLNAFPQRGRILEIGGGTGEDAMWLAQRGFRLLLTDPSPAMVGVAARKLAPFGGRADVLGAEDLESFAVGDVARFDGAFSNFASLNCVDDLSPLARGLARLLKPGSAAMLVLFGTFAPGEILVENLRGRPRQAFRRLSHGNALARLGGMSFTVRYHRAQEIRSAMRPWFGLVERLGIGIFVPPSAAEPWISRHPRLLAVLQRADRLAQGPLAIFGDHVLYHFERTGAPAP